jgi:acetate---CoA ligase (ADP-forming)
MRQEPSPPFSRGTRVSSLLNPRSIAIIGASEKSRWSQTLVENLDQTGFAGDLFLVNPRGGNVHGRQALTSCAEIGSPVDLGIVLVPSQAVLGVVRELGEAGARAVMVLTSGFAETGENGAALEREVATVARRYGMSLLGPNSLGFANLAGNVWSWATPLSAPSRRSGVAIISQSGATALFLTQLAHEQDVGLSCVVATGNEADLDAADFLDHLLDQPETRAVAMFIETVRSPEKFLNAARRALAMGKPVVALKVGSSEVTARSAEAHTGALVGDDRVFEGLCRQFGIIRVRSVEDLLVTADIAAYTGILRPGGIAVVSNSGGICEIAADRADELGLVLPELSQRTADALRDLIPGFGTPHNPLDLTGGVDPAQCEGIVRALGEQTDYAALLCPYYPVPAHEHQASERLTALHRGLARGVQAIGIPGLLVSYSNTVVTDLTRKIIARDAIPYRSCGLDRAVIALAGVAKWSERQRAFRSPGAVEPSRGVRPRLSSHPRTEQEALHFLCNFGVPVIAGSLVTSAEEAVRAAAALPGPVVIKIASPDIAHKSDIGGVALNVSGEQDVAAAFRAVVQAASEKMPDARIDGAIVSPMRPRGLELFVGVSMDAQWGPVLAVGLGGVWVEVLEDVSLRLLPVDAAEVKLMLRELRGAALLAGQRGVPAADLDAVAAAIVSVSEAALAAREGLLALEVNPLWVRGAQVEALDALFEWADTSSDPPASLTSPAED